MLATFLLSAVLTGGQIQAIDSSVREGMVQRHIPSVVVRVDIDGKQAYAKAFGYRDLADRLPANLTTRYQYGSITKQFTAAAILALMADGKLSLDDHVGKWLPEFAKFPVTIRELLVHTSGIADYSNEPWYDPKAADWNEGYAPLLAWSAKQPLRFTPGTKAAYDNAAYTMLARIVEKASGEKFFDFLAQRFLKPLHMTSVAPQNTFTIQPDTAAGYMFLTEESWAKLGLPLGVVVQAMPWNLTQVDGAGFLVGDVADLQRWDDALLAGRVLSGNAEKLFYTAGRLTNGKPTYTGPENPANKPGSYLYGGLGAFEIAGVPVYGANGGTSGFRSFTATIPSRKIAITTLTNLGADADNGKLTMPILKSLLEK